MTWEQEFGSFRRQSLKLSRSGKKYFGWYGQRHKRMKQHSRCSLSIRGCLPPEASSKTSNYTRHANLNKNIRRLGYGLLKLKLWKRMRSKNFLRERVNKVLWNLVPSSVFFWDFRKPVGPLVHLNIAFTA